MKKTILQFFILFQLFAQAQCPFDPEYSKTTPKRDLRGVFLTTVFNLDWPSSRTATPAVQQAELITILNNLQTNGYNTVFLQVRSECDAIYASQLEPWSYYLTGTQGLAPNPVWDPLSFAITQAHLRGLDLHAWLNPYRVQSNVSSYMAASTSILNTQPTWILTPSNATNLRFLNPGLPAVQDYIRSIAVDIATRYDVDGIHFDDYFYPNAGMTTNQDNATYTANNPTNIATIEDWRRNNVNVMIGKVYDGIANVNATLNKNVIFGVSPFGIWKSGTPTGISGNPSFSALYCDPLAWLNAGKVDYLAPQTYWKITGAQDYVALTKWWNDQVKVKNKQLYISQAYYKMTDTNNWGGTEIQNQIIQNRVANMDATFGQIAYRYLQIKNNDKAVNTLLNANQYQFKAFAPPIADKDVICANAPTSIAINGLTLSWSVPSAAADGDIPRKYVVYAFDSPAQAISNKDDGSKIIDILQGNQITITQNQADTKFFVVSSLDKNNNENGNFAQTITLSNASFDSEKSFAIYPNPFLDNFEISSTDELIIIKEVKLFDLSGQQVWLKTNINAFKATINPSEITTGFYLGKIIFENGTVSSFKIIKK